MPAEGLPLAEDILRFWLEEYSRGPYSETRSGLRNLVNNQTHIQFPK